jgi:hypothetical protein
MEVFMFLILLLIVPGIILMIVGVVSWIKGNKRIAVPCFIIGGFFMAIFLVILNRLIA